MPGNNSDNTQYTVTYPTNDQHARWKERADEMDKSMSGFIKAMVEAGLSKFDAMVEPDKSREDLREQRDDLKDELDHARDRISKLEDRLYRSDSAEIERFVAENPGADFDAIKEHLRATVPERANEHLTAMEGETIEVHDDAYYPVPETNQHAPGQEPDDHESDEDQSESVQEAVQ